MRSFATAPVFFFLLHLTLIFIVSGKQSGDDPMEAPEVLLEGDEIVIDKGKMLNLTCRGRHPVTWATSPCTSYDIIEVIDEGHEKPYVASVLKDSVDYEDVGYFFCIQNTPENRNRESWDPNDPLVSPVYVYVKDEDHLLAKEANRIYHDAEINKNFTLPCKPTFPEVVVTLDTQKGIFDPRLGFTFIPDKRNDSFTCKGLYKNIGYLMDVRLNILTSKRTLEKPKVTVTGDKVSSRQGDKMHYIVMEGTKAKLACIHPQDGLNPRVLLEWKAPAHANDTGKHRILRKNPGNKVKRIYEMMNADPVMDSGEYTCSATIGYTCVSERISIMVHVSNGTEPDIQLPVAYVKKEMADKHKSLTVTVELEGEVDSNELEVFESDAVVRQVFEGASVVLRCQEKKSGGSSTLHWVSDPEDALLNAVAKENETPDPYVSEISSLMTTEHGLWANFTCQSSDDAGVKVTQVIRVRSLVSPTWKGNMEPLEHISAKKHTNLTMNCETNGDPTPTVAWFKDENRISNRDRKIIGSNIMFEFLRISDTGLYRCEVSNRGGTLSREINLEVSDSDMNTNILLISGVVVLSIVVTVFCMVKICKDKNRAKMLRLEDHRLFVKGDPESINPELGLEEQAELLPYDTKFEIPRKSIIFDKLLGSGAFGRVYKATVANLFPGEDRTTVAVKMMKSRSDTTQLKVLRSEVKIMIHIGRHVNIVNLLGACSKELARKGELLLLVEYCKHGNILNYMRRHKNEFVNQINDQDKIDPAFTAYRRKESGSGASFNRSVVSYAAGNSSDGGSATQAFLGYPGTGAPKGVTTEAKIRTTSSSSSQYVTSDMTVQTYDSSNGGSGCSFSPKGFGSSSNALCSKDLLCWAFQIAKGMEYLAFKKVLHGDLAARNVLLAEGNVVKISDFGLAKDIYRYDNYTKKSSGPMPVKWLALECLRDGVFSTQSDVWSYGVVLWEIFTLGRDPYPGTHFDECFLEKLERGIRLEQPKYSTYDIYSVMLACWESNPKSRPSFTCLEEELGEMLGETEKQQCLDLNEPYQDNNKPSEFLSLIQSPDYSSIVQRTSPYLGEERYRNMPINPNRPCLPMIDIPAEGSEISHHTTQQKGFLVHKKKYQEDSADSSYLPMLSPTKTSQMMFMSETVTYVGKDLQTNSEDSEVSLEEEGGHEDKYIVMENHGVNRSTPPKEGTPSYNAAQPDKVTQKTSELEKRDYGLHSPIASRQWI